MQWLLNIRPSVLFRKKWMAVCYVFSCLLIICLGSITDYSYFTIISAIGALSILMIVLSIRNISIGFYGLIIFGFLLSFLDRLTNSSLPLTLVIFLIPFALFLFLVIRCIFFHERLKIDKHPVIIAYFLTVAYTFIQLFNPEMDSIIGWVSYFRQSLALTAILLITLYLFKDLKSIRFFFRFIIAAIFITALYGCIQQWIGLASSDRHWVYGDPDVLGLFKLPDGSIRKFSFFTDPANFGTLMASGGVGTLILALESSKKRTKILLGFFTVVIFLGMSYSGTRTANIMIAAGILLYILMTLYQKRTRILAVSSTMLFLFIMYAPIYGNVTINRFRTAFRAPSDNASLDTRLINRQKIRPFIHSHPFGGGVNTTGVTGMKYNPHHPLAGIPPDSSLVAYLMENGWVGLAMHLAFLFLIIAFSIHYYYKCENPEIKTYYAVLAAMLFSLGVVGAYAQYTLINVPQIFIYIPFIAITARLHTFDIAIDSKPDF